MRLEPRSATARACAPPTTVDTYLEEWLWGKQSLRASTHRSYEGHIRRYLTPHLGHLLLSELSARDIDQMHRAIAALDPSTRPSISTQHRIHATLNSALQTAVRSGLLTRNPATTVELPRRDAGRTAYWTPTEFAAFLKHVEGDPLHVLFLVLGLTGLRRGEAVALRWVDVDLNAGLLRVERSAVRVGTQIVVGAPKTKAGLRTIALDDETSRRLQWHQCRQRLTLTRSTGERTAPVTVFADDTGAPLDPAYVSRRFARLVDSSQLPRIRLHDLRHTSASLGLASGESLLEVSRRLGHSSITVTADIYTHVSPLVARESAERLARSVRNV